MIMNRINSFSMRRRTGLGLAVATTMLMLATAMMAVAADTKPADAANPAKKKLTGAELYAINCNRCHQERYPAEFTSAEWKTLMLHMRVRANLPAAQAKKILKYLQEESGN